MTPMNASPPQTGPAPSPPRKRRWKRWILCGFALLFGLGAVLLATGYPQSRLIEYAIFRATGFSAQVEGEDLYPELRIGRLEVFSQTPETAPALSIEDLAVAYRLMSGTGRRIASVTARHVTVRADSELVARAGAIMRSAKPAAGPALTYVPERVSVPAIDAQLVLPSIVADISGVALDCRADSLESLSFELSGDDLSGRVELPLSGFATSLDGGAVRIAGSRDGSSVAIHIDRVLLPNLAEVEAVANAQLDGADVAVTLDVPDFRILGEGEKTVLLPAVEIPLTVGSLVMSDVHVEGTYVAALGRFVPSAARLTGKATAVRAGVDDRAWDMYSVSVAAQGAFPRYDADVTVNDALPMHLSAVFEEEAVTASLDIEKWPREEVLAVLPPQYRVYLDIFPALQHISAQAGATVRYPTFDAALSLAPEFDGGGPFTEPLRAQAKGSLGAPRAVSGDLTMRVDQGGISAVFLVDPAAPPRLDARLDGVNLARLAAVTRWAPLPEALARKVSGTVSAAVSGGGIAIATDLEGAPGPWGTELLNPMAASLHAAFRWDPATAAFQGDSLVVKAEDALTVQSNGWRMKLAPLEFEGVLKGKAGLPGLSPMASELGVGAEIRYQAPVSLRNDTLRLSLDAQSDYLQYGDFSFYEAPFHAAGKAAIELKQGTGKLSDVVVTYGDSSSLNVKEAALSLAPFHVGAPYEFASKLRLLMDAGLLESVEGNIAGHGEASWGENLVITSEYTLEAPLLVTGGSSVALGGVTLRGDLRVDQAVSATASVNAAKCVLAGVPLTNVTAPMTMKDGVIRMGSVAGEVFGGAVKGAASVDMTGESPVLQADMRLRNVDLALFSQKMLPLDYGLQGLVQGHIAARLTPDSLEDATVKLISSGDFAMNKALLQNVLLEYLRTMPGGEAMERISTDVLGENQWRAFDSASLDLKWAEDKMAGKANLRSANLNLEVDVNIDEGSMRQLLALQQEARLEDIENIRSEPVQQSNEPTEKNE